MPCAVLKIARSRTGPPGSKARQPNHKTKEEPPGPSSWFPDLRELRLIGCQFVLAQQGDLQLFHRTAFDLPYTFLGNTELFTQSLQRHPVVIEAAFTDNVQFALVQRVERHIEPLVTAL